MVVQDTAIAHEHATVGDHEDFAKGVTPACAGHWLPFDRSLIGSGFRFHVCHWSSAGRGRACWSYSPRFIASAASPAASGTRFTSCSRYWLMSSGKSESDPMVVAVIGATMDTKGRRDSVEEDEAVEIATDYLDEIGWFSDGPTKPDHVVRV